MSFELDYTELDSVKRDILFVAGAGGVDMVRGVAHEIEPDAGRIVGRYAPYLPNQRYIRTDTYKQSTFSDVSDVKDGAVLTFGSRGAIQNGRRYDQYLKDARKQAAIHQGRWKTLDEDATEVMGEIYGRLSEGMSVLGFS